MIYAATKAGTRHETSEDAVLVGSQVLTETAEVLEIPERGFVCVADGVGGVPGGAQASRFVLQALSGWEGNEDLRGFLRRVNAELISFAKTADAPRMATTLTGLWISEEGTSLLHVGNTRAYVKQGRYLKQLTSDQTTYHLLMTAGQPEAAAACNRNEITNCFGGGTPALLSRLSVTECPGASVIILTSDGVHEYVDPDELEEILLGDLPWPDKCETLLRHAAAVGSEDDLSVVILCRESCTL